MTFRSNFTLQGHKISTTKSVRMVGVKAKTGNKPRKGTKGEDGSATMPTAPVALKKRVSKKGIG